MEAVKKLQNATKLLQKVIGAVGSEDGLGPSPGPMCGFSKGLRAAQEDNDGALLSFPHV